MKRIFSLLLCAALSLSLLAGCGGKSGGQDASLSGQGQTPNTSAQDKEPEAPKGFQLPAAAAEYTIESTPKYYAEEIAPEQYLAAYNKGIDSDTKEDISVDGFAYSIYQLRDSAEKVAVCTGYTGPANGVTEITVPGEVNGAQVYRVMLWDTLPQSVTTVVVEEGVELLENSFLKMPNLVNVELPQSLVRIFECFYDTPGLTEIQLPENLYWLQGFKNCTGLTRVTIPESVGFLQGFRFSPNLSEVTIEGEGLYCLGYDTFRGCTALTEVKLPDSVQTLSTGCFMDTSIQDFQLPPNVIDYGHREEECNAILANTPFMDGQTGDFVILGGRFLVAYQGTGTSVTIPDGVTHICGGAFGKSHMAQEIIVPEGVKVIDNKAICGTPSLVRLELPASLEEFGRIDEKTGYPEIFVVVIPQGSVAQEKLDSQKIPYEFK